MSHWKHVLLKSKIFINIQNVYCANYYLKKIKITTSDCCIFCNDMFETIQHVLCDM